MHADRAGLSTGSAQQSLEAGMHTRCGWVRGSGGMGGERRGAHLLDEFVMLLHPQAIHLAQVTAEGHLLAFQSALPILQVPAEGSDHTSHAPHEVQLIRFGAQTSCSCFNHMPAQGVPPCNRVQQGGFPDTIWEEGVRE